MEIWSVKAAISILDCTLRDGSYAVNQQFTSDDTARICLALEECGVRQIEIGHGVGLGASGERFGVAAATDEQYIEAAASVLKHASFGAFFIPGIGTDQHLKYARQHGMKFIRIGTNVAEYHNARHSIEYARELGFEVSYNPMKSYLATPTELLAIVRNAVAWGAQAAYVVDSAGSLLPSEVREYVAVLTNDLDIPIGFHGHNNLLLAIANCLAAYEGGGTLFDGTLQGLGRSGGNAQTEILAYIFSKKNVSTGLDVMRLLEAGEKLIRPLMKGQETGSSSLNVVIGMGGFHSSYLPRIQKAAERFDVDLKHLILEVCQHDRVDPSQALIDRVAADLAQQKKAKNVAVG